MNDKKIAFIMCVNDARRAEEAAHYIRCLSVPEEYDIDIICVYDAKSMAAGYNAAMKSSDAKYKVYLHQDTLIINKDFIADMVRVFAEDAVIGMLGCIGCDSIPLNGQVVASWNIGLVCHNCVPSTMVRRQRGDGKFMEAEAIDGLLMATQYDVPWREDLFDGWDFYDVSQCMEMRRAGYLVVVPFQKKPWCYHDNSYSKMLNYPKYCNRFIAEYQDIKHFQVTEQKKGRKELDELKEISRMELRKLVETGQKEALIEIFGIPENTGWLHMKDFEVLAHIVKKERLEGTERFWKANESFDFLCSQMNELHFALKRIEYQVDGGNAGMQISLEHYSRAAVKTVLWAYTEHPQRLWDRIQMKMMGR